MNCTKVIAPSHDGCRVANRIHGAAIRKPDWSKRKYSTKPFRGWKVNQLILSSQFATGHQFGKITGIHTNTSNGIVYGTYMDKKVIRNGYTYSMTKNGTTPGIWIFADTSTAKSIINAKIKQIKG